MILPVGVLVKIMKMLFHTEDYGGQVDDRLFREDVYNCFVAHPGLYRKVMTNVEMQRKVREAKAEYDYRKYYHDMAEDGIE